MNVLQAKFGPDAQQIQLLRAIFVFLFMATRVLTLAQPAGVVALLLCFVHLLLVHLVFTFQHGCQDQGHKSRGGDGW
jgi:hypothetical protein